MCVKAGLNGVTKKKKKYIYEHLTSIVCKRKYGYTNFYDKDVIREYYLLLHEPGISSLGHSVQHESFLTWDGRGIVHLPAVLPVFL